MFLGDIYDIFVLFVFQRIVQTEYIHKDWCKMMLRLSILDNFLPFHINVTAYS